MQTYTDAQILCSNNCVSCMSKIQDERIISMKNSIIINDKDLMAEIYNVCVCV